MSLTEKGEEIIKYASFLRERPTLNDQKERIYAELADIVGKDDISDSLVDLLIYNGFKVGGLAARLPKTQTTMVLADYVVHPETIEEVQRIVRVANRYKIPIVPVSGGTGPGHNPVYGGIVMDLKKLCRIIEIDETSCTTTVETGIFVHVLETELNRRGYELEHRPASYWCACVGGFIGDRSAGRLSTKYGKIEHMVIGMKIVLPNGEVFQTPPVPGHAAGPDLNHLFIGAGGTLGIAVEATLRIYPIPEKRIFRSFLFPTLHNAFEAIRKVMQADLRPCMARLYDPIETKSQLFELLITKKTAKRIKEKKGCAYLVLGFDGFRDFVDLSDKKALEICLKDKAEDLGLEEGQFFWDHSLDDYYPGIERPSRTSEFFPDGSVHVGSVYDYSVPMKYIETVWEETSKEIKKRWKDSIMYGHFSHWYREGTMMYPMTYVWNLPDDPKELALAEDELRSIVVRTAMKYGGTFQHHHGVGGGGVWAYGKYMPEQWGQWGFWLLYQIKKAIDPNNIMNPGMIGFEAL